MWPWRAYGAERLIEVFQSNPGPRMVKKEKCSHRQNTGRTKVSTFVPCYDGDWNYRVRV